MTPNDKRREAMRRLWQDPAWSARARAGMRRAKRHADHAIRFSEALRRMWAGPTGERLRAERAAKAAARRAQAGPTA